MSKTLLLSDLHLLDKSPGYLDSQISCIKNIVKKEEPDDVVIMGDVFMHRKPSPKVLLEFQKLLKFMDAYLPTKYLLGNIHILRGNHDSETKADDGITALSLFEKENIHVYTQTKGDREELHIAGLEKRCVFIPHYEDEEIIKNTLSKLDDSYIVFGHFAYNGCLNSLGNIDFSIGINEYKSRVFLGHIHKYATQTNEQGKEITILGTQYTTNFGEAGKENYYGVFEDGEFKLKLSKGGPKHIVKYYTDEYFIKTLDIPKDNYVLLRIYIDPITQKINGSQLKMDILNTWENVKSVEINYKSSLDKAEDLSNYKEDKSIFAIDEDLIKNYVNDNIVNIPVDDLMSGYYTLSEKLHDSQ